MSFSQRPSILKHICVNQPLLSSSGRKSSSFTFSGLRDFVSSDLSFFDKSLDLSSPPIRAYLSGYDFSTRGPFPVLVTPCIREVLDIDTVMQRATIVLDICMDWVGQCMHGVMVRIDAGRYPGHELSPSGR